MTWFELLLKVLFAFVGIAGVVIYCMSFDNKKSIEQGLVFNVAGVLIGTGGIIMFFMTPWFPQ